MRRVSSICQTPLPPVRHCPTAISSPCPRLARWPARRFSGTFSPALYGAAHPAGGGIPWATEASAQGIFYVHVPDVLGYHTYVPHAAAAAALHQPLTAHDAHGLPARHPSLPLSSRDAPEEVDEADAEEEEEEEGEEGEEDAPRVDMEGTAGAPSLAHRTGARRVPLKAGARASTFMLSPVYARAGLLWQWRTVRCAAPRSQPSRPSSTRHSEGRDGHHTYVLVPFLLHLHDCGGRRVGDGDGEVVEKRPAYRASASVFVDRTTHHSVAATRPGAATTAVTAAADTVVVVPCALGDLDATVLPEATHASLVAALTPTAAPLSPALFTRAYLDLVQRTALCAETRHAGLGDADAGGRQRGAPTFEYVCRVHAVDTKDMPRTARGDDDDDGGDEERDRETEMHALFQHAASFAESREPVGATAHRSHRSTTDDPRATDGHAPRNRDVGGRPRCLTIPPTHQNVLSGGVAALALAIDTYAALIVRKELSLAAACWAVLCDTKDVRVTSSLRTHAREIERDLLASVAAHEAMQQMSLARHRTLVGQAHAFAAGVPRVA